MEGGRKKVSVPADYVRLIDREIQRVREAFPQRYEKAQFKLYYSWGAGGVTQLTKSGCHPLKQPEGGRYLPMQNDGCGAVPT